MSFTFTLNFPYGASRSMDTPDEVAFYRTGNPPPPTPVASSFPADLAHPRTPDGKPSRKIVLPSNAPDSPPFHPPSVSSVAQPVLHSPTYNKSKVVSSTTQVQHESISVASAPSSPSHVGGPDVASGPPTVSSGPSVSDSPSETTIKAINRTP